MFTAENFRRIYDRENRKGNDLVSRFFPDLAPFTFSVKEQVQRIRELRANQHTMNAEDFSTELAALKEELKLRKAAKSSHIDIALEEISQRVIDSSFRISLTRKIGPNGKDVFCIDHAPDAYFVVKQLQININRIYKVKQENRHDLVSQLRDTVQSKFPFEIVRTDISSFYESIDRKRLLQKLDDDQLLSATSKRFIRQALNSYGALSGSSVGIPRGLGISAYLAELYLRPLDQAIREIPGVVLYCRYVDDIVVVFARPPSGKTLGSYETLVTNALKAFELSANLQKTKYFSLNDGTQQKLEYLGYRFVFEKGSCQISPSSKKVKKYHARLKAAFSDYAKRSHVNGRYAFRTLVARVRFLTSNTHLTNSKSHAAVGVFYSNSLVNQMSSFKLLDKLLKKYTASIRRPSLRTRLKPFTFESGFTEKRYCQFTTKELQTIVRIWKHG